MHTDLTSTQVINDAAGNARQWHHSLARSCSRHANHAHANHGWYLLPDLLHATGCHATAHHWTWRASHNNTLLFVIVGQQCPIAAGASKMPKAMWPGCCTRRLPAHTIHHWSSSHRALGTTTAWRMPCSCLINLAGRSIGCHATTHGLSWLATTQRLSGQATTVLVHQRWSRMAERLCFTPSTSSPRPHITRSHMFDCHDCT